MKKIGLQRSIYTLMNNCVPVPKGSPLKSGIHTHYTGTLSNKSLQLPPLQIIFDPK